MFYGRLNRIKQKPWSNFCRRRCVRSPIYQALPFVFDTIFEATGHVVVVVSPLVNRITDQVDKLANLGVLVASLSEISEENARGLRARKNLQGVTDRIPQTVWDFTCCSKEKITFRLLYL